MFKTYETAREIFDCLVDFHFRVAHMAETGMDMEQEDRVSLVFNFLYDHHIQMQEALASYEDDDDESVLNTPVSYSLNAQEAPEAFVESLEYSENMSFEKASTIGKELAEYIIGLLNDICGEMSAPHVQEVFENLLEMEQEELKLLIRGINSLENP